MHHYAFFQEAAPNRGGFLRFQLKPMTANPTAKKRFLASLSTAGNISRAAEAAGVNRSTPYAWRESDPEFARQWDEAEELGLDELEQAAKQRALDSSDTLLIFLLKSKRRGVFGDQSKVEMSGVFTLANLRDVLAGAE